MQHVPAFALERLAPQLAETRHREDIHGHLIVFLEQHGSRQTLAQNGPGSEQSCAHATAPADLQQIHAFQYPRLDAGRHRRLHVVLVHAGDVIENTLLLGKHAPQAVVDDDRQFVCIRRIVGDAVGDRRRNDLAVTVLMLQALAGQGRAACGCANEKAARLNVACGPDEVADALKAEHQGLRVLRRVELSDR